jgi:hypothetical protein
MHHSNWPWTEDDIAKLRQLAQKYPAATIARQLGRSSGALSQKSLFVELSLRMRRPKRGKAASDPSK